MSRPPGAGLAALALVACLIGTGCAKQKVYGETASRIETARGDDVVVVVDSNPTTGYSWVIGSQPDPSILGFLRSSFEPGESSMPGTAGQQRFVFRAVGSGTAMLRLDYRRPWEQGPPARSAAFTIVVR